MTMHWKHKYYTLLFKLFNLIHLVNGEPCDDLRTEYCGFGTVCSRTTVRIWKECDLLYTLDEELPTCTQKCRDAILDFWTTSEIGSKLSYCDCLYDSQCHIFKQRSKNCVQEKPSNNSFGCTRVLTSCRKKHTCYRLYQNWFNSCGDLINGETCTRRCLEAEDLLYNDDLGSKLMTCECDGYYESDRFCREVRFHREKLCNNGFENLVLSLQPTKADNYIDSSAAINRSISIYIITHFIVAVIMIYKL